VVFTVGHSNHPAEWLEKLLRMHRVTALADVRSSPYSRFNPQFNRRALAEWLRDAGIAYGFMGRELGGRSDDPADYAEGRIRYDRLAAKPAFKIGLERIIRRPLNERTVLLCAEKEPLDCHRTLLVAPALADRGIRVQHILADGTLESHDQAMDRLLETTGLKQANLFGSTDGSGRDGGDPIAEAIRLRALKVGYALTDRSSQ
jgi:uncharacterized protein (DUF488 family)